MATRRDRRPAVPVVLGLVLVALLVVVAAVVAADGDADETLLLVVSPHPDDEMQAWSQVEQTTASHVVFAFMTRGEETGWCEPALPGLDVDNGEAVPEPEPAGRWTPTCGQARVRSTMAFLSAMGAATPAVPEDWQPAGEVDLPPGEQPPRRCDGADGAECHETTTVLRHRADGATALFFDLGDGDVTTGEVAWALAAIEGHRDRLGLPDGAWTQVVGASYHRDAVAAGPADCVDYPHPDHAAVSQAVPRVAGSWQVPSRVATCRFATDATTFSPVSEEAFAAAFTTDGARVSGAHGVFYGWLARPYWPADPRTCPDAPFACPDVQGELFHRHQTFTDG